MNHPGDHIALVIEAVRNLYGDLDCDIYYTDKLYDSKETQASINGVGVFCKAPDGKIVRQTVFISIHQPLRDIPEALGHELAHIVAGPDAVEHGKTWLDIFDRNNGEYNRLFDEKFPHSAEAEEMLEDSGCDGQANEDEISAGFESSLMDMLADFGVTPERYQKHWDEFQHIRDQQKGEVSE